MGLGGGEYMVCTGACCLLASVDISIFNLDFVLQRGAVSSATLAYERQCLSCWESGCISYWQLLLVELMWLILAALGLVAVKGFVGISGIKCLLTFLLLHLIEISLSILGFLYEK